MLRLLLLWIVIGWMSCSPAVGNEPPPPVTDDAGPSAVSVAVPAAESVNRATDPNAPPQVLPGWRLELLAQSPQVQHPSVVAVAPDGRLFVAEDPMDIRAIPASAQHGRILCRHVDGTWTVYADQLHAVFGMQYVDGYLYVLHNPYFSRFQDAGTRAGPREDLITSTLPEPWAQDWNDHVPANFKLGLDGRFYVAIGDKGLFNCTGRDGSVVSLHGGGILRLKPDGTQLEIFCSGVRNILDVALTQTDELFTYDNTDEQQWMGRVTHMVQGGFYGYPFDFIPRRPYTLWCLADYGGGAATGTLAYTEQAWGEAFVDSLFLADFGKRNVLHVNLKAANGSFEATHMEELFPNPPGSFRPVGIALDFTGQNLFLCDWQHVDNKEDVSVGRLWKLTRENPPAFVPYPGWAIPAAQGKSPQVSETELALALQHPARTVRHVAARRLAERGTAGESVLLRTLTSDKLPELTRVHALWALFAQAESGQDRSAQTTLPTWLSTSAAEWVKPQASPLLASQMLRMLGMLKPQDPKAARWIEQGLIHPDPTVRRHAAAAATGINGVSAKSLLSTLQDASPWVWQTAMYAFQMQAAHNGAWWNELASTLTEPGFERAEYVIRNQYDLRLVETLTRPESGLPTTKVAPLLAALHRKVPEWNSKWWSYHPVNQAPPKKTEAWEGSQRIEDYCLGILNNSTVSEDQLAALDALGNLELVQPEPARKHLLKVLEHSGSAKVRATALRVLAQRPAADLVSTVNTWLADEQRSGEERVAALRAAGSLGDSCLQSLLATCTGITSVEELKAAATSLGTLGGAEAAQALTKMLDRQGGKKLLLLAPMFTDQLARIKDPAATEALIELLDHRLDEVRLAAVRGLGDPERVSARMTLVDCFSVDELRTEAARALIRRAEPESVGEFLTLLSDPQAELRDGAARAMELRRADVRKWLEERADQIPAPALARLRRIYESDAEAKAGPLFSQPLTGVLTTEDFEEFALGNSGDPVKGKQIYLNEQGAGCFRCHSNQHARLLENPLGPDLSGIGSQFSRGQLIEHVLHPSRSVREGYQNWNVITTSGEVLSGLPRGETGTALLLMDRDRRLHEIPLEEIEERIPSELSLMPADLQQGLSLEEFADLISFLQTCRADGTRSAGPAAASAIASAAAVAVAPPEQESGTEGEPSAVLDDEPLPDNLPPEGFKSLFNGRNLAEWDVNEKSAPHWYAKDGVLHHDGKAEHLWTRESFANFELHLDWRFPGKTTVENHPLIDLDGNPVLTPTGEPVTQQTVDGGDSGVFLRGYPKAQANLFCYPIGSGEVWEYRTDSNMSAEIRKGVTPSERADRPVGEWNHMEIRVVGSRMTVTLNGKKVIHAAELPGIPASGPIGLQHEHGSLEFKNLYIKELSESETQAAEPSDASETPPRNTSIQLQP